MAGNHWNFIPQATVEEAKSKARSVAYVESVELVLLTNDKPRWVLAITGTLPTPCNQPRFTARQEDHRLLVELFSVRDPNTICIEVIQPFQGYIDLSPWIDQGWAGEVWLNGQLVGRIER
ncbi:MAG: hypothetical protein GXO36_05895 [Chloroflexi bacterium]|nr:hypothetical protein [Chloroflexota bacterium]